MIYLIQILRILNNIEEVKFFDDLFHDLDCEVEELGYKGHEVELVTEMLENHFSIYIEDDRQKKEFTRVILNKSYKSAVNIELLRRAA